MVSKFFKFLIFCGHKPTFIYMYSMYFFNGSMFEKTALPAIPQFFKLVNTHKAITYLSCTIFVRNSVPPTLSFRPI